MKTCTHIIYESIYSYSYISTLEYKCLSRTTSPLLCILLYCLISHGWLLYIQCNVYCILFYLPPGWLLYNTSYFFFFDVVLLFGWVQRRRRRHSNSNDEEDRTAKKIEQQTNWPKRGGWVVMAVALIVYFA